MCSRREWSGLGRNQMEESAVRRHELSVNMLWVLRARVRRLGLGGLGLGLGIVVVAPLSIYLVKTETRAAEVTPATHQSTAGRVSRLLDCEASICNRELAAAPTPPPPPSRWQIIAPVEECVPPSVSGWQAGLERHTGARTGARPPSWTVRRVRLQPGACRRP